MTKPCTKPVKTNPFLTYRDPTTGRWVVIKVSLETTTHYQDTRSKSNRLDSRSDSQSDSGDRELNQTAGAAPPQ